MIYLQKNLIYEEKNINFFFCSKMINNKIVASKLVNNNKKKTTLYIFIHNCYTF